MKRHLAPTLLTLLLLTACADGNPPADAVGPTATTSPSATAAAATPTASAAGDESTAAFLGELRRQARSLTPEVADDEALLTLGEMGCKSAGDEEMRRKYTLNATLTMGYTDDEARAAFRAAERHLC